MYRVSLHLVEKSMIENSVQIFNFKIGIQCKSSVSSLIMFSRFLLLFYVLFERLHKKTFKCPVTYTWTFNFTLRVYFDTYKFILIFKKSHINI